MATPECGASSLRCTRAGESRCLRWRRERWRVEGARARVPPRRLLSLSDHGRENLQEFGLWTSGSTPSEPANFRANFVFFGPDSLRPLFGPMRHLYFLFICLNDPWTKLVYLIHY